LLNQGRKERENNSSTSHVIALLHGDQFLNHVIESQCGGTCVYCKASWSC